MKPERYILSCTELSTGKVWFYGSLEALCAHKENPLEITSRRVSQLKKENGYPVEYRGCRIDRHRVWSNSDIV